MTDPAFAVIAGLPVLTADGVRVPGLGRRRFLEDAPPAEP